MSATPGQSSASTGASEEFPFRYTARLAGEIEHRWQERWEREGLFHVPNPGDPGFDASRPKFYCLDMFPYPSGAGLHVGHPEGYTATDILCRFRRMRGYNVLHPMGWDAFGLPAEQYAIQTGVHPAVTTRRAIDNFRRQLKRFGFCYDWSREVATIDEAYYRWTQWIFLKIYDSWYDRERGRARPIAELIDELERGDLRVGVGAEPVHIGAGRTPAAIGGEPPGTRRWHELDERERRAFIDSQRLAYVGEQTVNWCPKLGTVLANEEVIDGRSERGGFPVFRKPLRQWMFRITAYAERLLKDLSLVDWPESTRTMQAEWIGRSEGAEIDFPLATGESGEPSGGAGAEQTPPDPDLPPTLRVFTTRPDTIFGAAYMVVAPEHPLVEAVLRHPRAGTPVDELSRYVEAARNRSDVDRQESREKSGVFTGVWAVNPASGRTIPVWCADYVLMGYGFGAIMAVPAHDERDFEFAEKFGLEIVDVVYPSTASTMHYFVRHATEEERLPERWQGVLADLLGLVHSTEGVPADPAEMLPVVRSRRAADREGTAVRINPDACTLDRPGAVGRRRGSTQIVWLDAISDLRADSFDRLRGRFESGHYIKESGEPYAGPGTCVNSSGRGLSLDGLHTPEAKERVIGWLEDSGRGRRRLNYRLRDWLFSRQRYWGEPFPIVWDGAGDHHAVDESALPVALPEMEDYKPAESDDPQPLLAKAEGWARTTAGAAGVSALPPETPVTRETNTMPGWAGSCWYYLRYCDPGNAERFVGAEAERYWMGAGGVDLYIGGAEHAVLHLLYARFWHKVLYDLGLVGTPEPFARLFHQGLITSYAYQRPDKSLVPTDEVEEVSEGRFVERATGASVTPVIAKMSKSLKNVVNPDDVIAEFGADTFRLYEMYMGPLAASKPWNTRDIIGLFRFLQRVWRLGIDEKTGEVLAADAPDPALERLLHRTTARVERDLELLSFNTAIAALIEFVNEASAGGRTGTLTRSQLERLCLTLSPLAPHLAEEIASRLGRGGSLIDGPWPSFDEAMLRDDTVELPVQVQGKVRSRIRVPAEAGCEAVEAAALADEKVREALAGRPVKKVIVVPGRMINIVTG